VLQTIDVWIIACYLVATTLLGVWFGRGQHNRTDFFLGGRSLPTWALLLSIVATETSTVTFLSVPGMSFAADGNFFFLQLAFGYILGRLAVILLLLPIHFSGQPVTAYEIFQTRFGLATRRLASTIFLLARTFGDGMRLLLTALALQIALQIPFHWSVLAIALATGLYSYFGGVKSVVWNDCLQFFVYMGGALIVAGIIVSRLPGGIEQVYEFAQQTGRDRMFDWRLYSDTGNLTMWAALLGGGFLSLATHGADQLMVQRYLCAPSRKSAAWALAWSGPIVFLQFALFLCIGVGLACYFQQFDPSRLGIARDQALASFVVTDVAPGLRGIILAAVFAAAMSTLSSSVNSSASSLLDDIAGPWYRKLSDRKSLTVARVLTLFFVVAQSAIALGAHAVIDDTSVITTVLSIAGFAAGLLLGLYFLGSLVGSAASWQANTALFVGAAVTSLAYREGVNGLWFSVIGCGSTLATGLVLHLVAPSNRNSSQRPTSDESSNSSQD